MKPKQHLSPISNISGCNFSTLSSTLNVKSASLMTRQLLVEGTPADFEVSPTTKK